MKIPKFEDIKWIHQIKLPDGSITPGIWLPRFEEFGLTQINFSDKRVLDIGCIDGLYTFYAEKKGAKEVVSFDINEEQFGKQNNLKTNWSYGYLYAHKALKSKAKYIFPFSVYDLNPSKFGYFDIVLFLGVIYHLTHPLLALERINEVMKMGGILVLESEISNTFTRFYASQRLYKNNIRSLKPAKIRVFQPLLIFKKLVLFAFTKPHFFISYAFYFITQQLKKILWFIVGLILKSNSDIYKNDNSNHWIMSCDDLEKLIDFAGYAIEKKIRSPIYPRVTYICRKTAEINKIYSDHSIFSQYKNRVSNFDDK